jgi:uncharacterized protein YegL
MTEDWSEFQDLAPHKTHHPLLLAVDASGSMSWPVAGDKTRMDLLEEGLKTLKSDMQSESSPHFSFGVEYEVGVISFGKNVAVEQNISPVEEWETETPTPEGTTLMGEAIKEGIRQVEKKREFYKKEAIAYENPTIFLITDGEPTDMSPGDDKWNEVQNLINVGTNDSYFYLVIIGIGDEPNIRILENLLTDTSESNATIIKLDDSEISEFGSYVAEFLPRNDLS